MPALNKALREALEQGTFEGKEERPSAPRRSRGRNTSPWRKRQNTRRANEEHEMLKLQHDRLAASTGREAHAPR
jgi:hypothetical protein